MIALRILACAALVGLAAGQVHSQQPPAEERLPAATPRAQTVEELAAQTVVVFNQDSLDSTALAGLYAEKRGIPPKNLLPLRCSTREDISRKEYDETIATPLRQALTERGLWKLHKETTPAGRVSETKVRFMVLIHGVPLRVAEQDDYPGDSTDGTPPEIFTRNECSVDSELSVLGLYSPRISGVFMNPYFRESKVFTDAELTSQILVCRLDGPSPAVVRRMIEDSVAVEKTGLRGFTYIDARGITEGPLQSGDKWFLNAARDARENGLPVILDNGPALFPAPYPMKHAAVYLGWYAEQASGPFVEGQFKFAPGAVTLHLHSFSGTSVRSTDRYWCGPLLAAGAAATLGNVYEPFLGLTPQPDIFAQRLREGFTFAEAGYMSIRALSWMTTFVGDPLYRPYLNRKDDPSNPFDAYRMGVRTWLKENRAAGETALREAAKRLKSGEVSEALGLLEASGKDYRLAIEAFQQARAAYSDPDDRIRVAVHESGAIAAGRSPAEAAKFLRAQAAANADSKNVILLSYLAQTYNAPPDAPKPDNSPASKPTGAKKR
jgi:uncharacterized protein (TIGR03790 family)